MAQYTRQCKWGQHSAEWGVFIKWGAQACHICLGTIMVNANHGPELHDHLRYSALFNVCKRLVSKAAKVSKSGCTFCTASFSGIYKEQTCLLYSHPSKPWIGWCVIQALWKECPKWWWDQFVPWCSSFGGGKSTLVYSTCWRCMNHSATKMACFTCRFLFSPLGKKAYKHASLFQFKELSSTAGHPKICEQHRTWARWNIAKECNQQTFPPYSAAFIPHKSWNILVPWRVYTTDTVSARFVPGSYSFLHD